MAKYSADIGLVIDLNLILEWKNLTIFADQ